LADATNVQLRGCAPAVYFAGDAASRDSELSKAQAENITSDKVAPLDILELVPEKGEEIGLPA